MQNRIRFLRIIGISEGISFLLLLMIAMPMKYFMQIPEAVKFTGWAHGLLFMVYIVAVLGCIEAMKWNWFKVLIALGASLLPFGTFVLDKELKRREAELKNHD